MNARQQIIDRIMEDRRKASSVLVSRDEDSRKEKEEDDRMGHVADMLDALMAGRNRNTQRVTVQNFPKFPKVQEVVLREKEELTGAIEEMEEEVVAAVRAMARSIGEELAKERSVTVSNLEVPKFPDFPKRTESAVVSLPKYVQELLEKVVRTVKEQELSVTVAAPEVNVDAKPDLVPLERRLAALEGLLESIRDKEHPMPPETDLGPLRDAMDRINGTVDKVRENTAYSQVATYKSSWERSFDMKSKDLPTQFSYKASTLYPADATKDLVDWVQVTDLDGKAYRKTFTYNASDKATLITGWTLQP